MDPVLHSGSGTDQSQADAYVARGRPPSGPRKRQSLLSLQLRSASSLPVNSYYGSDDPCKTPSLPLRGESGLAPELDNVSPATEPLRSSPSSSLAAACSVLRAHLKAPGKRAAHSMDTRLGSTSSLAAATSCRAAADTPFSVFAYPSAASSVCQLPDCSDPDAMLCGGSVACSSSGGGFHSSGSTILHYRDENSGAISCFHHGLSSSPHGPEDCLAVCSASDLVNETSSTVVANFVNVLAAVRPPAAAAIAAEGAAPAIDVEDPAAVPGPPAAAAASPAVRALCTADAQTTAVEGAAVAAPSSADGTGGEAGGNSAAAADPAAAAEVDTATAMTQGQHQLQHQHRTLAEAYDDASRVRLATEPVSGGAADGESSRRGRGSKGVTFASLFSTVLVLPSDAMPPPTERRLAEEIGCGEDGGVAAGRCSSSNNHDWGAAAEQAGVRTRGSRAVLTHSLSLGRAGLGFGARRGGCDVWVTGSEAGPGKLAALKRGNWSSGSGGGDGGSNTIKGLLTAEIEPAMYEGTVRRGLPRRAVLGRALSQPITQEMLTTLLDSGDLEA